MRWCRICVLGRVPRWERCLCLDQERDNMSSHGITDDRSLVLWFHLSAFPAVYLYSDLLSSLCRYIQPFKIGIYEQKKKCLL